MLRRFISSLVLFAFFLTSVASPDFSYAQVLNLPQPGTRLALTAGFSPALLRGLVVSSDDPFRFDFIVDTGDEKLSGEILKAESQRMVNYFLATLAVPQKDLWVNLSPVEKDRIIPDELIKTELGRDLLAQDYILKQLAASLIYPEDELGHTFWARIYDEAYQKFGVTDLPVDVFNKVWIVPETASVVEKGNAVYVTKAHLKVMLEADYLAASTSVKQDLPEAELTKQVLRDVIVPAIEKEVNEGRHFAPLRQIVYAMVLAQWYQDVLKESVLNKAYSGRSKVAGIDLSDPKNKELIYAQYMAAYKKGVFNYIKEETDRLSQEPVAKKYFSGGFHEQKVGRKPVAPSTVDEQKEHVGVSVQIDGAEEFEPAVVWNSLDRPKSMLVELKDLWKKGKLDLDRLIVFMDKYSAQVASQEAYPIQSAWPVLKAITLLPKAQELELYRVLKEKYDGQQRTELVDKILLMNGVPQGWFKQRVPHLAGRAIYNVAAEVYPAEGGLGEVMQNKANGEKQLGADTVLIQPWYQRRANGEVLDYKDTELTRLSDFNENFDKFTMNVGAADGSVREVKVEIASAVDMNGVPVYLFRDIDTKAAGESFYTKMLYHYMESQNPVTKEESMSFLNMASAKLILRLEQKRRQKMGSDWRPAVVHGNDGQFGPLQAVTMSQFGTDPLIKDVFWGYTTHTYGNRGGNDSVEWGLKTFLKHMCGIKDFFLNAFRAKNRPGVDHTSGGVRLAHWAGAVSNKHRDDVVVWDPDSDLTALTNGADTTKLSRVYREEFSKLKEQGVFSPEADYDRPTAQENALTKRACKERVNALEGFRTAAGNVVQLDLDKPLTGYVRRLVPEKAGRQRAYTNENIWRLMELGYVVLLGGRYQGPQSDELKWGLVQLERDIVKAKAADPAKFPGQFFFVDQISPEQKAVILPALDLMIQDSDDHTGAAEYSEELATGAFVGTGSFREGVIADQGIPMVATFNAALGVWEYNNPGEGNTVMPKEDTSLSWRDTVFAPFMKLWQQGADVFYQGGALTPRIIRIMEGRITSAGYMRQYEKVLARRESEARQDKDVLISIMQSLAKDREAMQGILVSGRDGVMESFGFQVVGRGMYRADPEVSGKIKGLKSFVKRKNELEAEFGYDAFLKHYIDGDYQDYLEKLFDGLESYALLADWIKSVQNSAATIVEEEGRMERFIEDLSIALEQQLNGTQTTNNYAAYDGGIDARNIKVKRQGQLATGVVSNKALEDMLTHAAGVQGVIVGIKPIEDVVNFLGMVR